MRVGKGIGSLIRRVATATGAETAVEGRANAGGRASWRLVRLPSRRMAPDLLRNVVDALPAGELERKLALGRPLRVKLGVDPTSADLHLGHTRRPRKAARVPGRRPQGRADHRRLHRPRRRPERALQDAAGRLRRGDRRQRPHLPGAGVQGAATRRLEIRRNSEWLDMPMEELFAPRAHHDRGPAARARRLRQALAARRPIRCSSCSIRCCRATTRSPCAPTSSSAGPTRSSTCCSAGTSSGPTASPSRSS